MKKLLLIEDEKILRENTCELLEHYGFECITAEHGNEGLEKAIVEKPDLIICDIMLPYLTGFQIKDALNKQDELALTPLIFLSAKVERADLRQGMDLGACDYITKPFRIGELINSINTRLEQSKNIQTVVNSKVINSLEDFIHIAKHECNTPLNGIINLSSVLPDELSKGIPFLKMALKGINTSGKRLYKTINNLIDLIQLRHYTVAPRQIQFSTDVKRIIEQTVAERGEFYNYRGEVKLHFCENTAIQILQEDIEIVIFEVIDNMFKFSSSNGVKIDLNSKATGNTSQNILTISNSLHETINFNSNDIGPFIQYERAKNEQQGSGLGLYLTKLIMERYQGTIELDSSHAKLFRVILTFPSN